MATSSVSEGAVVSACLDLPAFPWPIIRTIRQKSSRIVRNGTCEAPHSRQTIAFPPIALVKLILISHKCGKQELPHQLAKWFKMEV